MIRTWPSSRFARWLVAASAFGLCLASVGATPVEPAREPGTGGATDTPAPTNPPAESQAPATDVPAEGLGATTSPATGDPVMTESAILASPTPAAEEPAQLSETSPLQNSTSTAETALSATDTPAATETTEVPLSITETPSETAASDTPTPTDTETPTSSPTTLPTMSPTPAPEEVHSSLAFDPGSVLINEVAWAGTEASANDEWIELWNPGPNAIDLSGWRLTDGGDIDRQLSGSVAAFALYLLERTDDTTVADVTADLMYTGSLANGGETLRLIDPAGNLIDTANSIGGAWPAGGTSPRASMERHGALDVPVNWTSFAGAPFAHDADGSTIFGTPRQPNSPTQPASSPTPTPSFTPQPGDRPYPPGSVLINEVAWAGTKASSSDEWIELFNPGLIRYLSRAGR